MEQSKPGKLIFFDGIDGCGKTTQLDLAAWTLAQRGEEVYTTRIHGGSEFGEALRPVSLSKVARPPLADLHLSLAIHAALAPEVNQRRSDGQHVLIDRSPLSIIGYQMYGDYIASPTTFELVDNDMAQFKPDLIIVYQASVRLAMHRARRASQGKSDYFDSKPLEYFERANLGYQVGAGRYGAHVIDANPLVQQVHEDTMRVIDQALYPSEI